MASSSNKTKKWNIYSTHYSPANSSSTSSQTASSDQDELPTSRRSSSEYLPYGRQRSVFPYGIVSEFDLKDSRIGAETSDRIFPEKLDSITTKWRSSSCLESSSTAPRWGTKILQTSCRSPSSEDGDSIGGISKPRSRPGFRKRMHSCPSAPVNDFLRVEVPRLSSIMVQAQSLPLVSRPLQPVMPTKLKPTSASMETRRQRAASLNSFERSKKSTDSETRSMEKEVSKSLSEIKIEDGIIIIDNGKAVDLRKDKRIKKQHKLKHTEAAKSRSYREFQAAMQKFEDAQLNLEGEVKAKAKTFETKDEKQDIFNEHVQTQLLDLLSSVKEKRKKTKGKKYRC